MNRIFIAAVLLIILTSVSVTMLIVAPYRDRSLDIIRHERPLRIGYAVEAPYAFLDASAAVTGADPELARLIAGRIGASGIEWHLLDFASLIPAIEADQIDVIAAGMFITSKRSARVAFSIPTLKVTPGLLVARGNPFSLHSYKTLALRTDFRIAVLSGSSEEETLLQLGVERRRLYPVAIAESGRMSVCSGRAGAFALSAPSIRWLGLNDAQRACEIAEPFDTENSSVSFTGFAFHKNASGLRAAWNAELEKFIGSRDHLELIRRFGLTGNELPHRKEPIE